MLLLVYLATALSQPAAPSDLQQGLIAMRDGKLSDAKGRFERALKADPQNPYAWVSLAETCRRLSDDADAGPAAQKAEEFGGNIPAVEHALASYYTQENQFARAAVLEEKYSISPKADSNAALRTAELYQRAGDQAAAERVLKATWSLRPSDPLTAFTYAQFLLQKLDFAGAEKAIAPAAQKHPDDAQLVLVSGVAQYGERRFTEAIDNFLKVIAIDPTIPQPYEFIGRMLEHAGSKLPAITKAFEARVKNAPDDALANLVLAKAKLAADSKDATAEPLLRRSVQIDPKQWEPHYQLGVLLESKHDYQEAADELRSAIELDPQQSMPHYHLARVYDRLGQSEQAESERKIHEQLANASK